MKQISLGDINIYDVGNEIQMAGTIWAGLGKAFVTLIPDSQADLSELTLLPMSLPEWERFLKQTDILETEIIGNDPQTGKIIKSIVRKTQRQIDAYLQWEVFRRDKYTCRYCGRTGIPLTVDHIDLWEEGGATIEANLLAACKNCNKTRGRLTYEVWLDCNDYKQRSRNLSEEVKKANELIRSQLDDIRRQRVQNIRTR